jgi:hypothetical protein
MCEAIPHVRIKARTHAHAVHVWGYMRFQNTKQLYIVCPTYISSQENLLTPQHTFAILFG